MARPDHLLSRLYKGKVPGFLIVIASLLAMTDSYALKLAPADTVIVGLDTTDQRILTLNRILIIGNKITRDQIILRELTMKPGDTITAKQLQATLQRDRNKIYNLRLFNTVSIRLLKLSDTTIDLLIEVDERWYIFPIPIFELSDRNFNEWWQNYNHDFSRVNYGLRLYQYNFRGRNETLRFTAQFGYTRNFDLTYRIPYIDKKQKQGLSFSFDYAEPKNLAYFTEDHKLLFLEGRKTLKKTIGGAVSYTYRKSFYSTHAFNIEYRNSSVIDTIAQLNPNFYFNSSTNQRFASVSYSFNSDHRDVQAYPLNGHRITAYVEQTFGMFGGNVNQLATNVTYSFYKEIGEKLYLSNFSSLLLSAPNKQPYALYNALGYRQQFIRGYEIYVIEGPNFFMNKTTLKRRIFSRAWHMDFMPISQFRYLPISIYLKGYLDAGYVQNYHRYEDEKINTRLSDRVLAGTGLGVDIVMLYDNVLRIEYTFNREGVSGFFFNIKKEF